MEDSAALPSSTAPPALVFPTVGSGPKSWALTDAQIAEWQSLYPGIDVGSECRKAWAWVQANQPKTARGMLAFLVNWLNRATNTNGGRGPAGPPSLGGVSALSPRTARTITAAAGILREGS